MKKYNLVEVEQGKKKTLTSGTVEEIVQYLQKNKELMNWIQDEDKEIEMPNLDDVEHLRDLVAELEKVNLSWWELRIE